jgi:hypothetical protein
MGKVTKTIMKMIAEIRITFVRRLIIERCQACETTASEKAASPYSAFAASIAFWLRTNG